MPVRNAAHPLRYHHARLLKHVRHGLVVPVRETDVLREPACASGPVACDHSDDWHLALHMEAAYASRAPRLLAALPGRRAER